MTRSLVLAGALAAATLTTAAPAYAIVRCSSHFAASHHRYLHAAARHRRYAHAVHYRHAYAVETYRPRYVREVIVERRPVVYYRNYAEPRWHGEGWRWRHEAWREHPHRMYGDGARWRHEDWREHHRGWREDDERRGW
jgi:hypothetical protein